MALLEKAERELAWVRDTPTADGVFALVRTLHHVHDWALQEPAPGVSKNGEP